MLMNNTYREKLLNAILFFVVNVKKPSKLKIFKLLYFLDFRHYKETGRSVTNLTYYALEKGPVPLDLYSQVADNNVPVDFEKALAILPFESEFTGKKGGIFKAKRKVDLSVFSPRETRILAELAEIFREIDAKMISDISHFKKHPWDRTFTEKGPNAKIDYALALDPESEVSLEDAATLMQDRQEMLTAFPLKETI